MSPLVLRKNISRPLTHEELDNNFKFLEIPLWVKNSYKQGEYVVVANQNSSILYRCELTHSDFIYDQHGGGNFILSYTQNNQVKKLWSIIGSPTSVNGVEDYILDGSICRLTLVDNTVFEIDLNETTLSNSDYSVGISNHSYELITNQWTQEVISGDTYNTHHLIYGDNQIPSKYNVVIVDLVTSENLHHLVYLPDTYVNNTNPGIIYKIVVKQNDNDNQDKFLMLFSPTKRLISANIKTKYNDSYFLPLETMENVEIIWDGSDYLVTNLVKQGYTSLNANNFIELDPLEDPNFTYDYIERKIDNLL